jgi:pimeloyl-ACP methyl ester carboxylesterase
MKDQEIYYHGFKLHYEKSGNGNKVLLVFHGYGQSIETWQNFLQDFENNYCIYYFHLFGHGKSKVDEHAVQRGLSLHDWQSIFSEFLAKESIAKFSLLSYSLGAKLGILTSENFSEIIENTIFLAPDGVKPDYAQILFLRNQLGRWLLKWFQHHPDVLNRSLFLARKAGLINQRAHQYFLQQTETKETRNFVVLIWYAYRKLRPNIHKAMQACLKSGAAFFLFYGNRDSLIHKKYIEEAIGLRPKELQGFNQQFETGHNLMIPEVKKTLSKLLVGIDEGSF